VDHWKAAGLDLSQILYKPVVAPTVAQRCVRAQDHGLDKALDNELVRRCAPALTQRQPVEFSIPIRNVNRTAGTILGSEVTRAYAARFRPGVLQAPRASVAVFALTADTEAEALRLAKCRDLWITRLYTGRPGAFPSVEEALAYPYNEQELAITALAACVFQGVVFWLLRRRYRRVRGEMIAELRAMLKDRIDNHLTIVLMSVTQHRESTSSTRTSPEIARWLLPSMSLSTTVVPPNTLRPNASGTYPMLGRVT
jgi:hypothetical protein